MRYCILTFAAFFSFFCSRQAAAEIAFEPTWQPPRYDEVRSQVAAWVDASIDDDVVANQVKSIWPAEGETTGLLDRVIRSFAESDQRVAQLLEPQRTESGSSGPSLTWLNEGDVPEFVRHNVKLYMARRQVHAQLYDEAVVSLLQLKPSDVVDPAALLFYRMSAYHQIVQPEQARAALIQLLEHEANIPRRFAQVARLVERDLANLDDQSLDHIARRMDDIRRRLAIGRAGARVQQIERDVVKSLDKLIKEEQDRQRQQQSQSQSGGSAQNARPMEDSRPAELKGPGRVDPKDIGSSSGWGDLPPKQREQALEQLGREFPAHYRELIEQYFRDLADSSDASENTNR